MGARALADAVKERLRASDLGNGERENGNDPFMYEGDRGQGAAARLHRLTKLCPGSCSGLAASPAGGGEGRTTCVIEGVDAEFVTEESEESDTPECSKPTSKTPMEVY